MSIRFFNVATLLCVAGCSGQPPAPANPPSASSAANENNDKQAGNPAPQAETPQPPAQSESAWKPFSPPEGHYTVLFPVPPQVFPSDDPAVKNYGVEFKNGRVYMISESERPTPIIDPVKGLTAMSDAQVGTNERLFDREISLDGNVGRTFGYVDPDGDVWQTRAFIKGNTVFQLYAMAPKAAYVEDDPDLARFFDSFRIKAADEGSEAENPPAGDEK
jgi:hypothetical protein